VNIKLNKKMMFKVSG